MLSVGTVDLESAIRSRTSRIRVGLNSCMGLNSCESILSPNGGTHYRLFGSCLNHDARQTFLIVVPVRVGENAGTQDGQACHRK